MSILNNQAAGYIFNTQHEAAVCLIAETLTGNGNVPAADVLRGVDMGEVTQAAHVAMLVEGYENADCDDGFDVDVEAEREAVRELLNDAWDDAMEKLREMAAEKAGE